MDSVLNIGLLLLYSICGSGSAILAKIAVDRALQKRRYAGAVVFATALCLFGLALLLLFTLLHRMPVGLVAPIAVGFNLLLTSLAARVFFHESVSRTTMAGNGFIIVGIVALSISV
jgi:multidrug transporter EmrE-like cation transporter